MHGARKRSVTWAGVLLVVLLCVLPATALAQPVFGVRTDGATQKLVRFDTTAPGTILQDTAITGLQSGELIRGIDFNSPDFPNPEVLYALGSTSRLYTINTTSGAAAEVGTGPFAPLLTDTNYALEVHFDGHARVVSDTQNLRLDLGTGGATADPNLTYATGDPNFGDDPNVVGAGLQGENMFVIDSDEDVLALLHGPEDGFDEAELNTAGGLTVNTGPAVGFNVVASGLWAVLDISGASRLFRLNSETGAATPYPSAGGNLVGHTITGGIAFPISPSVLQASPSPLAFGNQPLGTISPTGTVTVTLTGGDAFESVGNIDFGGPHQDDFFLQGHNCATDLESLDGELPLLLPGDACQVRIRFAPSAEGTRTAAFNFHENKCCPSGVVFSIPLSGNGTSAPLGPAGPTGPAGPGGPQGPPGADATRLLALLGLDAYTVRTGRSLRLRFATSEAGTAVLEVRRGTRTLVRLRRVLTRGGNHTLTWNGRATTRSTRTRRPRGLTPGRYTMRLTVAGSRNRRATDTARLRIRR
jgi:Domain of unknown function (DUF4394)